MATRILAFRVTVVAGTPAGVPVSVDLTFDQGTVDALQIVIPDGHAGFTGLALQQAGQQVIPENTGNWIIGNNETIDWPLTGFLDNGSWQALMYNTDVFDHTFHLRFLLSEITGTNNQLQFALGQPLVVGDASPPAASDSGVAAALAAIPAPQGV